MNNKLKKVVASALCTFSLFTMSAFAQTEEKSVVKADIVKLSEVFDGAEIQYQVAGVDNTKVELKEKKGEYTRDIASGLANSVSAPVFSAGKKYLNSVFSMDMVFDFENGSGDPDDGGAWNAFQLRADETTKVCWSKKCYAILVKNGWVEIQKFGTASSGYILNEAFEIPVGEKVNVKYGAINTDVGVYVFLQVGDNVCGVMDNENPITEEGYMNFEFRTKFNACDSENNEFSIAVPTVSYDAQSSKLNSENLYITAGTEKLNEVKENKWFLSTDSFVKNVKERYDMVEEEAWEEIYGETASSLSVMTGDMSKYAKTFAILDNGVSVSSNEAYINPVDYIVRNGFVGLLDSNKALADGKAFVYDENNSNITPFEDEHIYVPVRGVSEAFGVKVAWRDELKTVYMNVSQGALDEELPFEQYPTAFTIGNLGWLRFRNLMGSSMVTEPINVESRSMLEYSDLGKALGYTNIYYLEDNGIIVYSPIALEFSAEDQKQLADYVEYGAK